MISSRNQNQFPSFFPPLGDLLKALMFLSNLNSFNSSPSSPNWGYTKRKGSSKLWKVKGSKWLSHFFSLSLSFCLCITCVFCFLVFESVLFMLCFVWHVFVCLFSVFALFCFHIKKIEKSKITKTMCVLCTLDGNWNKIF